MNKPDHVSVKVGEDLRARVDECVWLERINLTRLVKDALGRECRRIEKKHPEHFEKKARK